MFTVAKWCPVCCFPAQSPEEERVLCRECGGTGRIRCTRCICLTCSGTGQVHCSGCDAGRVACKVCRGTGTPRGFFRRGPCKNCEGTGQEYHGVCDGAGEVACLDCSGIGSEGECDHCGGKGDMRCQFCHGAGLAPSGALLGQARKSSLSRILKELPSVQSDAQGELLGLDDTLVRVVGFLGNIHWSFGVNTEDREHEMALLENRVHLRAAALATQGQRVQIRYRFLDVIRTGNDAFRTTYRESKKDWR